MRDDHTSAKAGLFPLGLFLLIVAAGAIGALIGKHDAAAGTPFEPAAAAVAFAGRA
jgi:hypothetical protein